MNPLLKMFSWNKGNVIQKNTAILPAPGTQKNPFSGGEKLWDLIWKENIWHSGRKNFIA